MPLSSFFPWLTLVVSQAPSTFSFENERYSLQPIPFTQLLGDMHTQWVLGVLKDSEMTNNYSPPQGIYDLIRHEAHPPSLSRLPQQPFMGLPPLGNPFPADLDLARSFSSLRPQLKCHFCRDSISHCLIWRNTLPHTSQATLCPASVYHSFIVLHFLLHISFSLAFPQVQ